MTGRAERAVYRDEVVTDQPIGWFVCEENLSGEYLVGVQDVADAGEPFGSGPDPLTFAELVAERGDPFRPIVR